jgi:hypothetical protein
MWEVSTATSGGSIGGYWYQPYTITDVVESWRMSVAFCQPVAPQTSCSLAHVYNHSGSYSAVLNTNGNGGVSCTIAGGGNPAAVCPAPVRLPSGVWEFALISPSNGTTDTTLKVGLQGGSAAAVGSSWWWHPSLSPVLATGSTPPSAGILGGYCDIPTGAAAVTMATGTCPVAVNATSVIDTGLTASRPVFTDGSSMLTSTIPASPSPIFNNSGTASLMHWVTGTASLSGGGTATVTFSGAAVYANTSYTCQVSDQTATPNAMSYQISSSSQITVNGHASDTFTYACVGL